MKSKSLLLITPAIVALGVLIGCKGGKDTPTPTPTSGITEAEWKAACQSLYTENEQRNFTFAFSSKYGGQVGEESTCYSVGLKEKNKWSQSGSSMTKFTYKDSSSNKYYETSDAGTTWSETSYFATSYALLNTFDIKQAENNYSKFTYSNGKYSGKITLSIYSETYETNCEIQFDANKKISSINDKFTVSGKEGTFDAAFTNYGTTVITDFPEPTGDWTTVSVADAKTFVTQKYGSKTAIELKSFYGSIDARQSEGTYWRNAENEILKNSEGYVDGTLIWDKTYTSGNIFESHKQRTSFIVNSTTIDNLITQYGADNVTLKTKGDEICMIHTTTNTSGASTKVFVVTDFINSNGQLYKDINTKTETATGQSGFAKEISTCAYTY